MPPRDDSAAPPRRRAKTPVGWREWVRIHDHNLPVIKAKVDTGAATSSLHAFDVELYRAGGAERVRFNVHPVQHDDQTEIACDAAVHDSREVRSSNGLVGRRPVIRVRLSLAGRRFPIELTLANRDAMGFRMLLGREALCGRFVVDPALSFAGGRPRRGGPQRDAKTL